jgi:hypothetical protein
MTTINLTRTNMEPPNEAERGVLNRFMAGFIDGLGDANKKSWRGFLRRLMNLEPGEIAQVEAKIPRNPKFHRKFFALLQLGFDAWEPGRKHKTYKGKPIAKNFENFREEITILAGFYEQTFDIRGRMKLRAKSISFANMEDPEFEQLYSSVADVLLEHVLAKYANRAEMDAVVDQVLGFV